MWGQFKYAVQPRVPGCGTERRDELHPTVAYDSECFLQCFDCFYLRVAPCLMSLILPIPLGMRNARLMGKGDKIV